MVSISLSFRHGGAVIQHLWPGLLFDDVEDSLVVEDGADLRRPGTIILFIQTLDLGGEWFLTVVDGHGGPI